MIKPTETNLSIKVKIFLDGKIVNNLNAGEDVKDGEVLANGDRLYNLIDLKGKTENQILKPNQMVTFETTGSIF